MASRWPASLKPISKYIQRAEETKNFDPIVSYYCTVMALQEGFRIRRPEDTEATQVLTGLLDKCESQKAALGGEKGEHQGHVEAFALSVFQGADDQDRAGEATRDTAKTFYAAATFLEACKFFVPVTPGQERELPSDLAEKHRYALWKAKNLITEFREGKTPSAGPPVTDDLPPSGQSGYQHSAASDGYQQPQEIYIPESARGSPGYPSPSAPSAPFAPSPPTPSYPSHHDQGYSSIASSTVPITPGPPAPEYLAASDTAVGFDAGPRPQHYPGYPTPTTNDIPFYPAAPPPSLTPNSAPDPPTPTTNTTPFYPTAAAAEAPQTAAPKPDTTPLFPPARGAHPSSGNSGWGAGQGTQQSVGPPPVKQSTPPQRVRQAAIPVASEVPAVVKGAKPDFKKISAAQRSAKNAASALDFEDINTAVTELRRALAALTGSDPS